jgi:hypothetical protein
VDKAKQQTTVCVVFNLRGIKPDVGSERDKRGSSPRLWLIGGPRGYLKDYDQETRKLRELIAKRERIIPQILDSQRRVVALATLLNLSLPGEDSLGMEMVGQFNQRGRLTEAVRHLLTESSPKALTTKTIVSELQKLGFPMEHSNPAAVINAIGNRLVEQKFAQECGGTKGKAWQRTRGVELKGRTKTR